MTYKEEFVVSHQTSNKIFSDNSPTNFKCILDDENTERFDKVAIAIKKVYCLFSKENFVSNVTPSIIISENGKVILIKYKIYFNSLYLYRLRTL